jgi:hypothetical protein
VRQPSWDGVIYVTVSSSLGVGHALEHSVFKKIILSPRQSQQKGKVAPSLLKDEPIYTFTISMSFLIVRGSFL